MKHSSEWIVLIGYTDEQITVTPEEGVELTATTLQFAATYHRMRREPNHTLSLMPWCVSGVAVELNMRPTTVLALEEPVAIALGAARCPDCKWERKS